MQLEIDWFALNTNRVFLRLLTLKCGKCNFGSQKKKKFVFPVHCSNEKCTLNVMFGKSND